MQKVTFLDNFIYTYKMLQTCLLTIKQNYANYLIEFYHDQLTTFCRSLEGVQIIAIYASTRTIILLVFILVLLIETNGFSVFGHGMASRANFESDEWLWLLRNWHGSTQYSEYTD